MKKTVHNLFLILLLTLNVGACSRLGDDEFSSQNQSLDDTTLTLDFSAEVNTTSYRSISFTNRSTTEYYEIFNIAKSDDVCSAFALYNITSSDEELLYDAKQSSGEADEDYSLSVAIAPGETVNINVQFSPIPCELNEYSPTMVIYYNEGTETLSQSVILNASVQDNSESSNCADPVTLPDINSFIGEEPSRLLPELEDGYYYAVVPYAFRGYLQPTEGFASLATEIYAYFGNPDVPEPGYLPPYLTTSFDSEGKMYLDEFDNCRGLYFPTATTDSYFLEALQLVSTRESYEMEIERENEDELGSVTLRGVTLYLESNINASSSIIQADNGNFKIAFEIESLTTEYTAANEYLQNSIGKVVDEEGDDILQIEDNGDDSRMYGTRLRHGEMILVGIGQFIPTDYEMSAEAQSGLIDTPAYLYIQIHARVTIVSEDEVPR